MAEAQTPTQSHDANSPSPASAEKPRLTEQEKKNNHIMSEQKRRQAIREGFDEIADIVPGLKGQGRSEALVLEGASNFLKQMLAERWRLVQRANELSLGSMEDWQRWRLDDDMMQIAKEAAEEEEKLAEAQRDMKLGKR